MSTLLLTGLAIGFFGSLHCVGMCGGLVSALCMTRPGLWWPGLLAYQGGRIFTYTLLGLVAGLLGMTLSGSSGFSAAQQGLALLAGALMILFALYLAGWLPDPFARLTQRIARGSGLSRWMATAASGQQLRPWLMVGLLNGLLPCGLVYAGLALALTADTALTGGLMMLAFGLGTLPAMTAIPVLLRTVTARRRGQFMKLAAVLLILLGLLTMFRASLHGGHEHEVPTTPAGDMTMTQPMHQHPM